jgi:hypothetical protein
MNMTFLKIDQLFLFIAFVIPGFVSIKTYELLFPDVPREKSKQLIEAIAYSITNYVILGFPIYLVETSTVKDYPIIHSLFYVFVILLAPICWVLLLNKLRTTETLQNMLPHPVGKPWEYVFRQRKHYWVIITLKDGKQIAGKYARLSFVSSSPSPEQIYLEETWVLNAEGGFERPRMDSAGILVLSSEITTIELFNLTYGEKNGEEGKRAAA